ncbi:MAG TPA: hypothetical protein VM409_03910, partial [Chloroflexia bacterium]|nr:hypothetical protein [Chloroflexia bacterium]
MNRLRRMGRNSSQQSDQTAEGDELEATDPQESYSGEASALADGSSLNNGSDEAQMNSESEEPLAEGSYPDAEPAAVDPSSSAPEEIDEPVPAVEQAEPVGGDAQADAAEQYETQQDEQANVENEPLGEAGATPAAASSDSETRVRKRAARKVDPQTAPLPQMLEPEALTPLPVGAVVDGRYIIQSQLHHSLDRNLYRVTARQQQWCGNCGRLSSAGIDTCAHCGSLLEGESPAEFYLMAESYRAESLIRDPSLMDLNLYHPNLVPVIDFFSYKPFGTMRFFAVAEPRQGVRLSQLSMPRAGGQVLSWAMQLADALSYLHERGVVGAGAEADDILVQGDRASLASLQNAHATGEGDPELAQQQSVDLARLASTMYEAYTGQQSSLTPEGLLPMPPGAPGQVGAAFRAAIEPMQGTSPAISVARWREMLADALDAVDELERPGRPVLFTSASMTDVGRVRDQNQDSYATAEWVQASAEGPMRVGLYIIA